LSRVALIFGEQALLDEYNKRVAKKLNKTSSTAKDQSTATVGFARGMKQLGIDLALYHPHSNYLGQHCVVGALFDAKKQFYRLVSLLLSDLEMIFDLRCPSPWQVISALQARGILSVSDSANVNVCLSIANEIRLKTYFANKGQKELLSPVTENKNTTEQSNDPPIFRYFDEDILVRLLSISNVIHRHFDSFFSTYIQQRQIDTSLLGDLSLDVASKTTIGTLYYRLQNLPKALEWMESEPKDSLDYPVSLMGQGLIYEEYGEYEKSIKCYEHALDVYHQNEENSHFNELSCLNNLAYSLLHFGQYDRARDVLEKAIQKHNEIYGGEDNLITLSRLKQKLGSVNHELGNTESAINIFKEVEEMLKRLHQVPDNDFIALFFSIASSLTELDKHAQSLEYVERALHLSKKLFGSADLSHELASTYISAAIVYEHCNRNDEAFSLYKQSLECVQSVFGDNPHPGKKPLWFPQEFVSQ
jgi:tetratricopeptide (TPR) repeat protein